MLPLRSSTPATNGFNGALLQIPSIVERELSGSGNSRFQSQCFSSLWSQLVTQPLGLSLSIVSVQKLTELLENLDKAASQDPRVKSWSQGYWGHVSWNPVTPD